MPNLMKIYETYTGVYVINVGDKYELYDQLGETKKTRAMV